jgi:MFS family permease
VSTSEGRAPRGEEPLPAADPRKLRRLVRLGFIDVSPLRTYRQFRLLFYSRFVTFFGAMITAIAIPWQVYKITGSSLAVGLLGAAEVVPIIAFSFLGGALADARDRRRIVQMMEVALGAVSLALMINAFLPHPQLFVLYGGATGINAFGALQRPSINALLPRLVPKEEVIKAGTLASTSGTIGMIGGPALGGILIAAFGLPVTYGIDVATFAFSFLMLGLMDAVPAPASAQPPSLRRIGEGLRYARSRQDLMGTYLVDTVAMFFGMPNALFPAVAVRFGGSSALGVLLAAPAVGSFLAVSSSGWASRVHKHGRIILLAAGIWGLGIVGFGFSNNLILALVCLGIAGAADMVSGIFRSAIWNQTIPDELRGRLGGIELLSYTVGPTLGNVEAGGVATAFSLRTSIVSGGILCVIGTGVLALALPHFLRYDNRDHLSPPAQPAETPG